MTDQEKLNKLMKDGWSYPLPDNDLTGEDKAELERMITCAAALKVSLPVESGTPFYGTVGQFAISDGNGGIAWKTLHEVQEVSY